MQLKIGLLFLIILHLAMPTWAQEAKTKRLLDALVQHPKADTARLRILADLCWAYRNSQPTEAFKYGKEALTIARNLRQSKDEAKLTTYLGVINRNVGNYPQALEYFLQSIKVAEANQDWERLGYGWQSLGDINQRQGNYVKAEEYLQKALEIFQKIKDENGLAYTYYTWGQTHEGKKEYEKAIEVHQKALKLRQNAGKPDNIASSYFRIGIVYQKLKIRKEANEYYEKAIELFKKADDQRGLTQVLNRQAKLFLEGKQLPEARRAALASIAISERTGLIEEMQNSYEILADVYATQRDYPQAFESQSLYLSYHDSLANQTKRNQMLFLQSLFEDERRQVQIKLLEEENRNQYLLNAIFALGIGAFMVLAIVMWRTNQQQSRANKALGIANHEIAEKNEELQTAFQTLDAQNQQIKSSIDYAQRIQESLLPDHTRMKAALGDCFVLHLPRDVVSGDFYWLYDTTEYSIVVVADCTGHGVPGAMMAMLGESLLNQIVQDRGIFAPHEILLELHRGIQRTLQQPQSGNRDGMDAIACKISKRTPELQYAGALNPLYYFANQQLVKIPGSRYSIGGILHRHEAYSPRQYELHTIALDEPTMFYLTTDGYQDQFGGPDDRKFMSRHFRSLLASMEALPLEEQQRTLQVKLQEWVGNTGRQTDDITIVGFKLG